MRKFGRVGRGSGAAALSAALAFAGWGTSAEGGHPFVAVALYGLALVFLALAIGLFWSERSIRTPREKATRLTSEAEWATQHLQNYMEQDAPTVVPKKLAAWEKRVLALMTRLGCSESDKSRFRMLKTFQPAGLPGVNDDHGIVRNVIAEKIRRLADIARVIEGLAPLPEPPVVVIAPAAPPAREELHQRFVEHIHQQEASKRLFSVLVRVADVRIASYRVALNVFTLNRSKTDAVSLAFRLEEKGSNQLWTQTFFKQWHIPEHLHLPPQAQASRTELSFDPPRHSELDEAERERILAQRVSPDLAKLHLHITDKISGKKLALALSEVSGKETNWT